VAINEVIDRDRGYNALLAGIGSLAGEPAVLVGVRQGAGEVDGTDLVLIASANEFGTSDGRVPERSFIRSTVDENRTKYVKDLTKVVTDAIDGKRIPKKSLERVGARATADIQRKIVALKEPANASSTIRQKKSSNPLVDTGRLLQSIDWEVR